MIFAQVEPTGGCSSTFSPTVGLALILANTPSVCPPPNILPPGIPPAAEPPCAVLDVVETKGIDSRKFTFCDPRTFLISSSSSLGLSNVSESSVFGSDVSRNDRNEGGEELGIDVTERVDEALVRELVMLPWMSRSSSS